MKKILVILFLTLVLGLSACAPAKPASSGKASDETSGQAQEEKKSDAAAQEADTKANEEEKAAAETKEAEKAEADDKEEKQADAEAAEKDKTDAAAPAEWVLEDGKLDLIDTESSPYEGGGVHVIMDQEKQSVKFIKTDAEGNDTVEYVDFHIKDKVAERYQFVAMMGKGFYYTYDLEEDALKCVENSKREDTTESSKKAGRFDTAAAATKEEVDKLKTYFAEHYGKEIMEAFK